MPRSTRSCRSACSSRTNERDIATAIDIARDLKVPILARGAGTSQCGQTTGAALVIDHSKHFRRVIAIDVANRTATVEPGLVLDHLNAQLKPHGLWFPVDVSTSAQATLGGMAGNNSCGSRSIAYGNMVHQRARCQCMALGRSGHRIRAGCKVGRSGCGHRRLCARAGAETPSRHTGTLAEGLASGRRLQPRYFRQSERASLHRLTVKSTSRTCWSARKARWPVTRRLELRLAPLPSNKVLGVVNFPTFRAAMDLGPAHRQTAADRGGAGRSHDDRSGAGKSGVPPDHGDGADRPTRGRPAGGIRRRRSQQRCCRSCGI